MSQALDLLPPNASPLERDIAQRTHCIEDIPITLRALWHPDTCPEDILPWLAWGLAIDRWNDEWHPDLKRAVIKNSLNTHKIRGTRQSIKEAIRLVLALADSHVKGEPLTSLHDLARYDNAFLIREWWEHADEDEFQNTSRAPLSFSVKLLLGGEVLGGRGILGGELYRALRSAIDTVKPLSTRYELSIGGAKLDAKLPEYHSKLRVTQYARYRVKPQPSLVLNSSISMGVSTRAPQQYIRKILSPRLILQFHSRIHLKAQTRSLTRKHYFVRPVSPLYFESTLPLTHSTRNISVKHFTVAPKLIDPKK